VATLQILKVRGANSCSKFLTFEFLDKIYDSMSKWWEYHHRQSLETHRIGLKHSLENYNNEFLIVYATDLISAVSADRDLTTHAVTHVAAGVALMGRLVCHLLVQLTVRTRKSLSAFHGHSKQWFTENIHHLHGTKIIGQWTTFSFTCDFSKNATAAMNRKVSKKL
jgi:hypothetical protein